MPGRAFSACLLAVLAAAGLTLPSSALAGSPTGRVLVLLHKQQGVHAQASAASAFIARTGARRDGPAVPEIGLVTVDRPRGVPFAQFAKSLRADPSVASVQPEHRMSLRLLPNDPALTADESGTPPGTPVQWAPGREGFNRAWDMTLGAGVTIGIIDTGIDGTHPDLSNKIAAAVDQDAIPGDGPATTDENGHGTHVASLACAGTDNGIGMAGLGFDCRLVIEKSDLSDASIAASIVDAANRGVDAINMSFGDDGSRGPVQAIVDAIDYAYQRNVVLVAAASDEEVSEQGQPANILQPTGTGPDIHQGKGLSVTAADFSNQRATFGRDAAGHPERPGFGTQISIAAYGAYGPTGPPGIFGAFPANTTQLETGTIVPPTPPCLDCRTIFEGDRRYAYLAGTSMAAPQVAAAAGLVRHLNPDLPVSRVLEVLKQTANRPSGAGWSPDLGWGILDAGAAVAAARTIDVQPPISRLRAPSRSSHRRILLRWIGEDPAPAGLVASGIARFDVYAAAAGHRAHRIATTRRHSLRFRGRPGRRYSFYTVAIDRAGNREAPPTRADARTRISVRAR